MADFLVDGFGNKLLWNDNVQVADGVSLRLRTRGRGRLVSVDGDLAGRVADDLREFGVGYLKVSE